ncbi:MAG: glycoside hydrolase family 92 protein, partial [Bacteroidetes bacterium]|nr:glycoside hydrolase family 92 protein [Bacteroidota bacterium]
KDGNWQKNFDPFKFGTEGGWNGPGYMEGNAWIYTYFVPHDVEGMISLLGKDEFNNRLEQGFETGHVDLTNQPNLQAPFLFNYSGKPWLTQKYSRKITDVLLDLDPLTGWLGDEDEGQMSSYYVLLSMGLFEMDGGCAVNPYYDLSSPIFDKITLRLNPNYYPGKTFTIITHNNSKSNIYIQSARLNGKPFNSLKLLHTDIIKGGTLELEMGDKPNEKFGLIK